MCIGCNSRVRRATKGLHEARDGMFEFTVKPGDPPPAGDGTK